MTAKNFSLDKYFERIAFTGEPKVDLATLSALMQAQLCSVPFENTEVQAGRIPSLEPQEIVKKIVCDNRGGYCYELNGLFSMALEAIGFEHYFVAARPMTYAEKRPKTHMVVIVKLNNDKYLCDCGFGGYGLRVPIKLEKQAKEECLGEEFFIELSNGEYLFSSKVLSSKSPQYAFADVPQEWIEFSLANYFNATHPNTIFTQKKMAIIQTKDGRKLLIDENLKTIKDGLVKEEAVSHEEAFKKHFMR